MDVAHPNFFIVGAAKAGTSSLDRYLSQHPDIYIPPKKEAHFFSIPDFPERFTGPGDEGMNLYTIRDEAAYLKLFDGVRGERAVGEASVFYLFYPGTAQRIYDAHPDAKILIMLRNPVDRAFSAYMHLVRDERETLSFRESLAKEEERIRQHYEPLWYYRAVGLYAAQVKRYLDVFGRDQVKVILFEDFARDPVQVVRDCCAFLGVSTDFVPDTSIRHNESGVPKSRSLYNFIAKPNALKEMVKPFIPAAVRERLGNQAKSMVLGRMEMEPDLREELTEFFAPDVARLEALIHRDLSAWRRPARAAGSQ
ncbi:sulfotransferase family protein [Alicyclobacillus mali (ex Roth et al. 2021)]|uniref:sulfotransferase family protein n=1 Tax=Alicyclobacillus mali (ex Roth et al. 2021) TaxID=1123961 RepID=UPI001A8E7D3B|nr:sulfotransferase [Alicyclobacillus mali (ex Roth et al. 2021)]